MKFSFWKKNESTGTTKTWILKEDEPLVKEITYNNLHLQCLLVQTGCIWYAEI